MTGKPGMPESERLQKRLDYRFRRSELLEQALTHSSHSRLNNERLEYLGDSLLNLYVAERLYHQFPELREGDLTRMRSMLVRRQCLADLARSLDLHAFLRMGKGTFKVGGQHLDSTLSNALEAIVGAIYLDSGLNNVWKVLDQLFGELLREIGAGEHKSPKSRLQELLQKSGQPLPEYRLVEQRGKDHDPEFTVVCAIAGCEKEFRARGTSRKRAEYRAAEKALEHLLES